MIPSGVSYSVWLFVPLFWLFSLIFIYPKPPTLEASFQIPPLLSLSLITLVNNELCPHYIYIYIILCISCWLCLVCVVAQACL